MAQPSSRCPPGRWHPKGADGPDRPDALRKTRHKNIPLRDRTLKAHSRRPLPSCATTTSSRRRACARPTQSATSIVTWPAPADAAHVQAQVIGDHGTAQVFLWFSARVGGVPVAALLKSRGERLDELRHELEREVRYAN